MGIPFIDNGFAVITKENADDFDLRRLHGRPRLSRSRTAPVAPRGRRADRHQSPMGAAGAKARIMSDEIVLEISNVSKAFGAVQALRGVDFELRRGEVHADRRRERRREIDADEHHRRHPAARQRRDRARRPAGRDHLAGARRRSSGIGFVHQEIALCPDVTVAENIFMAEINSSRKWLMDYRGAARARPRGAGAARARSTRPCWWATLSISSQQLVEIAKALTLDCRILILDEPTAALTEPEAQVLFGIMRDLAARGISIIYISHRMVEIFDNCDRVSVFRDGRSIVTADVADITPGLHRQQHGRPGPRPALSRRSAPSRSRPTCCSRSAA